MKYWNINPDEIVNLSTVDIIREIYKNDHKTLNELLDIYNSIDNENVHAEFREHLIVFNEQLNINLLDYLNRENQFLQNKIYEMTWIIKNSRFEKEKSEKELENTSLNSIINEI